MLGTKILEEKKSKFNGLLRVVRTFGMGTYIQSGGLTQSGGIVETIWKEALRRIKHKSLTINRCLILGLGGGTVARLVRKKWPKAKITGVDIDPQIVELGKKYLGMDNEIEIKIEDAAEYTKHQIQETKFDLIIVDLYRGDKFPDKFESENYTDMVKSNLSEEGLVIFNRLYYGDKRPEAVKFGRMLEKKFAKVDWFYPEANIMFICR